MLHQPGFSENGQNKGWISMKVNTPEEEVLPCVLQGFWQREELFFKSCGHHWAIRGIFFSSFFFFFFFSFLSVDDKILFQKLVFMDVSWRRKENIYFLFLLVNQNVLFKESALCRIAHELLPLMEIKEKNQEVFLVIPFPCLFFFFFLNSLYTHVLEKCLR